MAFLKTAKTEEELRKMSGVAALRKTYLELATDYNHLVNQDYLYCHKCNTFLSKDTFYSDKNYDSGHYPICKKCVMDMVEQKKKKADEPNETKESVQKVLQMMDLPYMDDFYSDCVKGALDGAKEKNRRSPFATYLTALKSLPNWKGKTWKDSDFGADTDTSSGLSKRTARKEIKKIFGVGFSEADYVYLQDQYDDFRSRTQVDSKSQEIYVTQICLQLLDIDKDRKSGKDVTNKLKALDNLMNAANLQPKQNVSNAATDALTFGQLIEKWEQERPIPDPEPEFRDCDGIGKYIRVWFSGHLSKALGLAGGYSDEYERTVSEYTVKKPQYQEDDQSGDIYTQLFGKESES